MLGRLCGRAWERAKALDRDSILAAIGETERGAVVPSLLGALSTGTEVAVIAEVKRRSPSKGSLLESMPACERAAAYARGGARALSVLTEPEEFGGSNEDLASARQTTGLPTIKKDFHVSSIQVWEARALGASALLLIARAVGPMGLAELMSTCRSAGIEALVEVRSDEELGWAIDTGASIIGVNCRDLETLEIEPVVHQRLLPLIPSSCIAVAESSISTRTDVSGAALLGADAVLVGSSLSQAEDPVRAVGALCGVARVRRGH